MKIISYSDLHLEFGTNILPASETTADVMILCGDIMVIDDLAPLDRFLQHWHKPVLYVLGNHEYYGRHSMPDAESRLIDHLGRNHPQVIVLRNECVEIDGVNFFGGTMWTDFDDGDELAMMRARVMMNDYRRIKIIGEKALSPKDTLIIHQEFVAALNEWFSKPLHGSRVIISHHAPTLNPISKYKGSELQPAFNSLDMEALILKHKPSLWFYGHTHECDDHFLGETRIISNQAGYPQRGGSLECTKFDTLGLVVDLG